MSLAIQTLVDGLMLGGVYAIIAVGLSLAFGVMRIVNFAHGEFLMLSMFISLFIIEWTSWNPYLVMIITGCIMFGLGYALQYTIFNRLLARDKNREPMSVLLFTCGLGMMLSYGAQIVFGNQSLQAKTGLNGVTISISDIIVSVPKLIAFGLSITFALLLFLFLNKSETGRAIRATSQNRTVATLMGVNQKRIYAISLGISIMLVGLAAGMLMPYYSVYPMVGQVFSFKSFVIVVLGGLGSVPGALIGGLLVGLVEKFGALAFDESASQMIVFAVFVAILLFKPLGLLGKDKD